MVFSSLRVRQYPKRSPMVAARHVAVRPIDRPFLIWLTLLYGVWILAWALHGVLHHGPLGELADRTTDTEYWLACKILIWLTPVLLLIRHETGAWNAFDWLGLRTTR